MSRTAPQPEPTAEPATEPATHLSSESLARLGRAVEEAARLLTADGAMVYLVDPDSERLVFAVDAGIRNAEAKQLIRDLTLPIGSGMFGHAVASREVIVSGDYRQDRRFPHAPTADRIAGVANMRSMAVAPLMADGEVLGALGAYSSRADDFDEAEVALLRALADHAATAIANQRLIERLARSQQELARRVDAQRTLAEMAAQLTSLRDPSAVLEQTLQAAARLLQGHGGQIGMVVRTQDGLRWGDGHSLVRGKLVPFTKDDRTPVDDGISGRAVNEGRAAWTDDYLSDGSFPHDENSDAIARQLGIRAVIAAPLVGDHGPIGAIGVYAEQPNAFDADAAELLGLLADQAAIVLSNARLYAEAGLSAERLAHRVEAQRALASISAEIASLHDPAAVLQRTAEEAMRLLGADTAIINPLENDDTLLGWPIAYAPSDGPADDIPVRLGEGISGQAMAERRVLWTGDYLNDPAFAHSPELDAYIERRGMRSVMTAPLVSSAGGLGALTVQAQRSGAFDDDDAELLRLLADQAAIAITNARLYDELGEESAALARQTDSQRRMLQINERLLSTLDPEDVLDLIADGLKSVVWYDYLGVYRVDQEEGLLHPVLARDRNAEAVLGYPIPRGRGVTWWSVEHREPVLLNDALSDPRVITIPGTPDEEEAIIIVPLISGDEVIGAMNIARRGAAEVAFTDADFELVQLFAGQAAIAVTNASLVEELRERADAQRSLAEIAAQIAALHDPTTVIQRAVADAARLLQADRAQVNLALDDGHFLDRPIAAAPTPPSPDDVRVPIGSGIAGMAAAEKRVRWTHDYLGDDAFPHDDGDRRIEAQDIHSMMSAPLLGPDRLLGTITVQSRERSAFNRDDAELLKLLADQAAIALTNARLYAEVQESERRYRHLVDNSPDIVWSVDAEGRFTFLSDALEDRTGWKPEQLIGTPFTALASEETFGDALEAWEALQQNPNRGYRVRLDLPLRNGQVAQTEVALTGTVVDGRFAGAHGSVRDISERERLEGDLRSQAAELAASQERAHLARELHDSVTQALFSMGLTLRTLELLLGTDTEAARAKLVELRELQKDALAEMRTLIFELRPSSLESDGLIQALRTHATAVQRRTGLIIVVDAEPIDRLPLPAEEALYRIGQEAIHNTVKHANASNATIRIARDGSQVRLTVTDDGGGFDPEAVPRGHLGLIGMRQRVELVGGGLRVESRAGHGTTIEASVPAPPSDE
ncbi:MAG: GAF domain-containing protein [Chloroflexi bacterium]|nr:GAF domain-containing protein [Chloroflexota bacterium]